MILLPTERCWHVTARLRNRDATEFTCADVEATYHPDGSLARFDVQGQVGFPLYLSLPDVALILHRRGWRRRRLRRWERIVWTVVGVAALALLSRL